MKALEPTARADRKASRSIMFVCFGWYGSVVATSTGLAIDSSWAEEQMEKILLADFQAIGSSSSR